MINFKKVFTLNMIFLAGILLINNTAYSMSLPIKTHLRTPSLGNSEEGKKRLSETLREVNAGSYTLSVYTRSKGAAERKIQKLSLAELPAYTIKSQKGKMDKEYFEMLEQKNLKAIGEKYVSRLLSVLTPLAVNTGIFQPSILVGTQKESAIDTGIRKKKLLENADGRLENLDNIFVYELEALLQNMVIYNKLEKNSFDQEEEMIELAGQLADMGYMITRLDRRWPIDYYTLINGEIFLGGDIDFPEIPSIEGGNIVYSAKDRFLLLSNEVTVGLKTEFKDILNGRIKVYEIPSGYIRIYREGKAHIAAAMPSHIDLSIGILEDAKILLVDKFYMSRPGYGEKIKDIAKAEGYKIVHVDEDEAHLHPANFIKLPDGKILMEKAPKTINNIQNNLPEGVTLDIIQVNRSLLASILHYGSIRCSTGIYYPIVSNLLENGLSKEEIAGFLAFLESDSNEISIDDKGVLTISEKGKDILSNEILLRMAKKKYGGKIEKIVAEELERNFKSLGLLKAAERVKDIPILTQEPDPLLTILDWLPENNILFSSI